MSVVKKVLKIAAIVAVVVLIGIQFVRPDMTEPPTDPAATLEANMSVPPNRKGP